MKDLSMHIMDIVQNSLSAKATHIILSITEDNAEDRYVIEIEDNGVGMTEEYAQKVLDPFVTSRTTRRIGLGLPLLKQSAERTGGSLTLTSQPEKGTKVTAEFSLLHPDRQPIGDIAGTIALLTGANPQVEFTYNHATLKGEFKFDTREVKAELDGVPIQEPSVIKFIKEMIMENLVNIGFSK